MRGFNGSVTRVVSVVILAVTLSAPAAYAAPRERDIEVVLKKVTRVVRHLISVVCGDQITDPKPNPPTP
jgi:hypothetical protein